MLHNHIKMEMDLDQLEVELDKSYVNFEPFSNEQNISTLKLPMYRQLVETIWLKKCGMRGKHLEIKLEIKIFN